MPEELDLTLNRADYANILALLGRVSLNGLTEAEVAIILKAKLVKAIEAQPIDPEVHTTTSSGLKPKNPKKGKNGKK